VATDERPALLVIGAAPDSLGTAVATLARTQYDFASVTTAGISGEPVKLDVTHSLRIKEVLDEYRPDIVVCTVGVNVPADIADPWLPTRLMDSFVTNVTGPLDVLRHFTFSQLRPERGDSLKRFVAISSNSARIPRTRSLPYCASKAALSMALRVAARELAGEDVVVWGYEPGLLAGTPMTQETVRQAEIGRLTPTLHRMKGVRPQGIPVTDLATRILSDVANFSVAHNGNIYPFDAGEI
jgi:NAD(P)-dependent dehydrogenase (short-subunit alcohol dehydrogenase family)